MTSFRTTHLKKILIFIVAYNAEKTISSVIKRIPLSLLNNNLEFEILVIDDASSDSTFKEALKVLEGTGSQFKITILRNKTNHGYGGNQKLGYSYAIKNNFDIVALLHGDGQYAPEFLPALLQPLIDKKCSAVFGSRMIHYQDALKGGMPFYKFIGNIILTFLQNFIAGTRLSEYHSGYRLYSCDALKKIPFEKNSNGFDFDTEIILQLHAAQCNIKELPIPTFYGDEICYVNGLQYALKILKTTIIYSLQKRGIFYQSKFDIKNNSEPIYQPKFDFISSHSEALSLVNNNEQIALFGCSDCNLINPFINKGCLVSVIDQDINQTTKRNINTFYELDLNKPDFEQLNIKQKYDTILLLDILEHLKNPEELLSKITFQKNLKQCKIIISTPNIVFFPLRLMFLFGMFNYNKRGILDKTHTRLFTFSSIKNLLESLGIEIESTKGIPAPFPLAIKNKFFSNLLLKINCLLVKISKELFSYQIFLVCRIKPKVEDLLAETISFSEKIREKNKNN